MLKMSAETLDPICGVYEIKNTETGRCYIGQSTRVQSRWTTHFSQLARGKHPLLLFQREWDKYGAAAFTAAVVDVIDNPDDLLTAERRMARARLGAGTKLYNAGIDGWSNEDEHTLRKAREKAKADREKRILQRKREEENETRRQRRGNSGDEGAVSEDEDVHGSGEASGDSPRAPVEGDERGVRIEEAGIRASEQGADRKAGAEGSEAQGMDEDRRRGKGDRDDKKTLPVFDNRAKDQLVAWAQSDSEPGCHLEHLCATVNKFSAPKLGYAIRAFLPEDEVKTIHDIVDPLVMNIWFDSQEEADKYEAWIKSQGFDDTTDWIMSVVNEEAKIMEVEHE